MIRLIKGSALFALIFMMSFPVVSNAADVPILTWERGRVQEIILGDDNVGSNLVIQIVGKDGESVIFKASAKNDDGFIVYSADIPADFEPGVYTIESIENNSEKTILAGINLIPQETYDIRTRSVDLTFVVGLLTFITVTLSSLRSKKYSILTAASIPKEVTSGQGNSFVRVLGRVINLRRNLTLGVAPSLFRHLLSQESQFLLRVSKPAYYFLPLFGMVVGFFAAVNAQANGGLEKSNLLFFFIITLIGLVDSFSGIFGLFTFWAIQFFYGDVANINQILVMVAAAIAWIGPSMAARVYQDSILQDFTEPKRDNVISKTISYLGSSLAATAIFYGGYKLLMSLLGEIADGWQMKPAYLAIIFLVAFAKAIVIDKYAQDQHSSDHEKFEIVRVASPQVATAAFLIFFGFAYSWTESALKALIAAVLFAAPYFFLFIRFEPIGVNLFARANRNILIESAVAVAASYLIYTQVLLVPQLSDQRAEIYLIAAAIPGLIHAIYSSICDSAQRKERITP